MLDIMKTKYLEKEDFSDDKTSECSSNTNNENVVSVNQHTEVNNFSDDETDDLSLRPRKRVTCFADSDSDNDKDTNNVLDNEDQEVRRTHSSSEDGGTTKVNHTKKSRIRKLENSSDSNSETQETKAVKNVEQQIRIKKKRNKLKEKFSNLLTSRTKEKALDQDSSHIEPVQSNNENSNDENDYSVENIKKMIKEKSSRVKLTICDPDTSDDEGGEIQLKRKKPKTIKLIAPKPAKMTAKQAMENMQKIKSESNRMLREKEVSLPYHRPKALSLKDIMNRRKPALSTDGKVLPIKMNEEQLKQYALSLEQRQKEMIELCKSDSEDDEPENNEKTDNEELMDIDQTNLEDNKCMDNEQAVTPANETFEENKCGENEEQTKTSNDMLNAPTESNTDTVETITIEKSVETDVPMNDNAKLNTDAASNSEIVSENLVSNTESTLNETKHLDSNPSTNLDSQLISLHYNSEKLESNDVEQKVIGEGVQNVKDDEDKIDDFQEPLSFSDDDINMDEIDSIIENAEIINDNDNIPSTSVRNSLTLNDKPKLTGGPGMVIDLNSDGPFTKKLTGVELLKERFTYFSNIKTAEELEREKEKKIKPGTLHLKLKQELEEQIAEQRSLEWAKRLEEEKQQQSELNAIRGEGSDVEDDLEKIEAKLNDNEAENDQEPSESESEEEEEIDDAVEKPRKRNPLIADEAEESDVDDCDEGTRTVEHDNKEADDDADVDENDEESDDSEESSESEEEEQTKPKKGRILKAFVDSDDEDGKDIGHSVPKDNVEDNINEEGDKKQTDSQVKDTQDEELQLAQEHKSFSEDLFTSQESGLVQEKLAKSTDDADLGSQTFSIMNTNSKSMELNSQSFSVNESKITPENNKVSEKLSIVFETKPYDDNLDAVVGMCTAGFSQNLVTQTATPASQCIGEDILALCTGKFYDNQFVSQADDDNTEEVNIKEKSEEIVETKNDNVKSDGILESILDELNEPEFDVPKAKFFVADEKENVQYKKKLVIESDEETNDGDAQRKKKKKRKKLEQRALQISDDEDDDYLEQEDEEDYVSEVEEDPERVVEYDSEENEVEVKVRKEKKKRKATDFFEQEAELTSEDEWMGSGDEDEAGLDRMEREEGDDETFHQGKLQNELGQIHLRDVLDQDKREVRLLQELLFEDGDLGDGGRQRKFRWKDIDGNEEMGTNPELTDTQEEEFESEEQWRKQRHEREVFLRQMQQQNQDDLNVSVNRSMLIKANLTSKTSTTVLETSIEKTEAVTISEKKTSKDIPSPKKPFPLFQQNYHGSLLSRGGGALARLAALATPLASDADDAPKTIGPTAKRNFVFAAITPEQDKPKVSKRKAESNPDTPKLIKKLKTEDKQKHKNSLLDHLKV